MARKVNVVRANHLTVENITGYIERQVVPHGSGAKVTCPREFLGKTAYLLLTDIPWGGQAYPTEEGPMTNYVQGANRHQTLLLPDTLDDYVLSDSAVRFIDAFVDGLNMDRLGFIRAEPPKWDGPLTVLATS